MDVQVKDAGRIGAVEIKFTSLVVAVHAVFSDDAASHEESGQWRATRKVPSKSEKSSARSSGSSKIILPVLYIDQPRLNRLNPISLSCLH